MPSYEFAKFDAVTITSNSKLLSGQQHRCSKNYHFHELKGGQKIKWSIVGGSQLGISFAVKEDKTAATDPVIFTNIVDGSETDIPKGDSIYIADVKQNGQSVHEDFNIQITVSVLN